METLVELRNLARNYGGRIAVCDLSLTIGSGEIFGLLGANGAGKSTTLKMLATLLLPSGGSGRVAGYDLVTQADEVRRRIGYVPEGAELYDVLTGKEFLDLVRDLHRLPAAEAQRRELMERNADESLSRLFMRVAGGADGGDGGGAARPDAASAADPAGPASG
jgi:ABC-2 type transport system ATP-binding protein